MEPVFILFLIFGICLILAAGWICILKDPRDSIFFVRAHSLRKKDLEGAKKDARLTAKYVAIVGVCIIVLSIIFGLGRHFAPAVLARLSGDDSYEGREDGPENSEDWLDEDYEYGMTIYAFRKGDRVYVVNDPEPIDMYEPLEDGCFYEIEADAKILNGGVAGYYNHPEIENVISCKEISPLELDIPSITERQSGLVSIGDYADGDLLLNGYYDKSVWKDGKWVWDYDDEIEIEDGTELLCRKGLSEEEAVKGIESGVTACEDYFLLPAMEK